MISRDAYQALLKIIPNGNNGTGATTICAPLKQTNYPKVKFLFKQDRSAYEKTILENLMKMVSEERSRHQRA